MGVAHLKIIEKMAQNYIQPGNVLEVIAPSGGYTSQSVVIAGLLVGIALGDAAEGEACEVALEGVWDVAKTAGTAWAQGDKLYFDATAKRGTKTSIYKTVSGEAAAAAVSAATTGRILLKQNG